MSIGVRYLSMSHTRLEGSPGFFIGIGRVVDGKERNIVSLYEEFSFSCFLRPPADEVFCEEGVVDLGLVFPSLLMSNFSGSAESSSWDLEGITWEK